MGKSHACTFEGVASSHVDYRGSEFSLGSVVKNGQPRAPEHARAYCGTGARGIFYMQNVPDGISLSAMHVGRGGDFILGHYGL